MSVSKRCVKRCVIYTLKLRYDGDQHATALNEPNHNVVAIDCPYTGKGDEFSPVSLLSISLASCMLLSMGAIAQRDNLDLTGTVVDIEFAGLEKRVPHVDSITLIFNIPADFEVADRNKLERAAELCPVMGSLGDDTSVITTSPVPANRQNEARIRLSENLHLYSSDLVASMQNHASAFVYGFLHDLHSPTLPNESVRPDRIAIADNHFELVPYYLHPERGAGC